MSRAAETKRAWPELRPRLRALADAVDGFESVADIATDHALLAAALIVEGRARHVIAIDKNEAPLRRASATLAARAIVGVELRRGDGFAPLSHGEAQAAVVAGIGGQLAARLIGAGVPDGLDRLWLQVNSDHEHLRRVMAAAGWSLDDESLVESDGRIFTNLAYRRAPQPETARWTPRDWTWGPHLRHERSPLYLRLRRRERAAAMRVRVRLTGGATGTTPGASAGHRERLDALDAQLAELADELDETTGGPGSTLP